MSGCKRKPPVLTERQVEQVFDAQQKIVDQQEALNQGRDDLETDRRDWADRERIAPIVANSIEATGVLIACCLPLAVISLLLIRSKAEQVDETKVDPVLVEMLSSETNRLPQEAKRPSRANLPEL